MPLPSRHTHSYYLPLLLLLLSILVLLYSFHSPQTTLAHSHSSQTAPEPISLFLSLSSGSNSTIAAHLKTLTQAPHLAGTPSSAPAAAYFASQLNLSGIPTLTLTYSPLLSYPVSSSLSLLNPKLTLSLSEPADVSGLFVGPYHAYSPSGSALGPPVYANYGRARDYARLGELGVSVRGSVVIVRRGEGPRGSVVEAAAENGATAVLMFGEKMEGGVERGTVLIGGPGDVLTPGWAAAATVENGWSSERLNVAEVEGKSFPRIPSMPVAIGTAREILRRMGGPRVPEEWRGAVVGEGYWGGVGAGAGPGNVLVNFTYQVIS